VAFDENETWSEALQEDSIFVKFLDENCSGKKSKNTSQQSPSTSSKTFDVKKMKCLAFLWCQGKD